MARIKTSAFITDVSGKIGGSVFQRCQSGLILKNSPSLTFSSSMAQNRSNSNMYRCQYEWQQLTTCQRQIWTSFANYIKKSQKHSKDIYLNGHQLFLQCNSYRHQYGFSTLKEPQYVRGELESVTGTLSIFHGTLRFETNRVLRSAYEFIILQVTTKVSPSLNNPGSRYRTIIFTTTNTDIWNITTEYKEVFGFVPVAGNVLFFKYSVGCLLTGIIQPFRKQKIILI